MEGNQRMMFGDGRQRSGSRLVNNLEQDSQRGYGSASDIRSSVKDNRKLKIPILGSNHVHLGTREFKVDLKKSQSGRNMSFH